MGSHCLSFLRIAGATIILLSCSVLAANEPPIIHPGAPGQASSELSASEAIKIANTSYSPDDVRFMADMIPHHNQATQMADLVADRTNRQEIVDVAGRINSSQADEIAFMQNWLSVRGEDVPAPTSHEDMHTSHHMAGMASPEQMAELEASEGIAFDRLFLQLMIPHHEGAVTMVEELLEQPGAAYDPVLFEFTTDVTNDQEAEIERMNELLVGLSDDPRAGLAAGFDDAEEAILNLRLVVALQKPSGFFDPDNPAGLPPEKPDDTKAEEDKKAKKGKKSKKAKNDPETEDDKKSEAKDEPRSPMLSFSNTDMAFANDVLVVGSYHGFNTYRLTPNDGPEQVSSVVCPGGQGDVSIVGDLLIMSVEQTRGRLDCGLEGITEDVSEERFRGIRIFDISDLERPVQVGAVQTCRGSHTHSVVSGPGEDGKIIVYNSGTSSVRDIEELDGCYDESPGDTRTALFRIDVIEIPVDDPSKARIVHSPAVFADLEEGTLAGMWRGGDHGEDTQETNITNQCHDITVFPTLNLAAGACSGNGIIFDISDPLNPTRIDEVVDKGFAYWHSATFNNDGSKVIFTDEWGGGSRARCRAYDPLTWGADAIYDIVDGKLEFRSHYKMPAPQVDQENCVAHNGSIVPVPGRDIFVQSWYQGGLSIMDFTDSSNPVEIAYFDRGPIDAEKLVTGGYWSSYWYGNKIYATEIVRGLDVFELLPSEFLSVNEIAAAALADQGGLFNPQQQFPVSWPDHPVVALAYLDQLMRTQAVDDSFAEELSEALDAATARIDEDKRDAVLAGRISEMSSQLAAATPAETKRVAALAATLQGISARLE